ncbi:MAG: TPM domain-containing protein [Hyphomicrobium sp.]
MKQQVEAKRRAIREMSLFSEDQRERVSRAISDAERDTSGEVIAVVAEASNTYYYVPFMWAAMAALIVPWPFIHFTWMKVQWIFLIQLLVFLALLALLWPRWVRAALVPRSIRQTHVRRRATEQFLAQNLHTTAGRTGVLIFVSVAERHAVILADHAIDAKVEAGAWQKIVEQLTREIGDGRAADGFVHAIAEIGRRLAEHFPPGVPDPNELPNHLIILDS